MDIHTNSGLHRAVCFSKDLYPIFDEVNNSTTTGIILKRAKHSNDDILITDFTQIKKFAVGEEQLLEPLKMSKINSVISESALYDRVNVKATITHLSSIKVGTCNAKPVDLITAVMYDDTGFCDVTLFGDIVNKIEEQGSCLFTHLVVSKYKNKRLLKSSEVTTIKAVVLDVDVTSHNIIPTVVTMICNVVSIDFESLTYQRFCPKCKHPVNTEDTIALCEHCSTVSTSESCSTTNSFNCTLRSKSKETFEVLVKHDTIKSIINTPVSEKMAFAKKLLALDLKAEIDTSDMEVVSIK